MAGKKGAIVQLQTEVNTEEEWAKLLEKEGLIVADIYSGWCGPCAGMVGNLKKLKLEVGGDLLHLAIVKADDIEVLERFRNKSEPTWMFIAAGQVVNLMFGANAPRLGRMVVTELEKEKRVLEGKGRRVAQPFEELSDEEKVRFAAKEKIRLAEKAKAAAEEEARLMEKNRRTLEHLMRKLTDHTVLLYMPFMYRGASNEAWDEMLDKFIDLNVSTQHEVLLDLEPSVFEKLVWTDRQECSEECVEALSSGNCHLKLLHRKRRGHSRSPSLASAVSTVSGVSRVEAVADLLNVVVEITYGFPPPDAAGERQQVDPESFAGRFAKSEDTPGMWTPSTLMNKAKAVYKYFPDFADTLAEEVEPPPVPRLAVIFDTSRVKEVTDMAAEWESEVLNVGFFTEGDPEKGRKISRNYQDYERLHHHKTGLERIVFAVSRVRSDALLSFATLSPVYISGDTEDGSRDCAAFFPPGSEEDSVLGVESLVSVDNRTSVSIVSEASYGGYERAADVTSKQDSEDSLLKLLGAAAKSLEIVGEATEAGAVEQPPPPA